MNLVFTPLEIAAVAAAVGISALIAIDGETNWLEGALLMLVYVILAVSFFEFVGVVEDGDGAEGARRRRGQVRLDQAATSLPLADSTPSPVSSSSSSVVPGSNDASAIGSLAPASPSATAWSASESAACWAS